MNANVESLYRQAMKAEQDLFVDATPPDTPPTCALIAADADERRIRKIGACCVEAARLGRACMDAGEEIATLKRMRKQIRRGRAAAIASAQADGIGFAPAASDADLRAVKRRLRDEKARQRWAHARMVGAERAKQALVAASLRARPERRRPRLLTPWRRA